MIMAGWVEMATLTRKGNAVLGVRERPNSQAGLISTAFKLARSLGLNALHFVFRFRQKVLLHAVSLLSVAGSNSWGALSV
jgi:hypothetical protein